MILVVFLVGVIYISIIASFFYGWEKLQRFETTISDASDVFTSIIVPVRDEEENIKLLLDDLTSQNYPLEQFEIILVDDHSSDNSVQLAKEYPASNLKIQTLPTDSNGKKAALRLGIQEAKGELIITTDADCRRGSGWLGTIVSCYLQTKPVMILAPVLPIKKPRNGLADCLSLEYFSLIGSTAGSAAINRPVMSNGANLAFSRNVYSDIEPVYQQNEIPSGDDVFALLKLKKTYPGKICYLKSPEAAVSTCLSKNITSFFKQRGRWTSKARYYKDTDVIFTALCVLSVNILLVYTLGFGIFLHDFTYFIVLMVIKSLIDFPFLYRVTSFFNQTRLMLWFPLVQSVYFLYVCITIFIAAFLPNSWKNRKI